MTISFITLTVFSLLLWLLASLFLIVPILLLYYMFIKRARLYCKAKGELKRVLQERDRALAQYKTREVK